jgi:hypothetical protein
MHIDQYRKASEKVNSRFSNKGNDHAAIVVEHLFRTAENTIRIYSGCIAADFYVKDSLKTAVKEFLDKEEARLLIITENAADAATKDYLDQFGDRVSIKSLEDNTGAQKALGKHFMVADGRAYRLETDDANREAVVNFNEPGIAGVLTAMFERAAVQAVPKN